jgi:hypothetical protein
MSPNPDAPLTMHTSGVGTPQTSARGRVLRSTKDNKYSPSKFLSPVQQRKPNRKRELTMVSSDEEDKTASEEEDQEEEVEEVQKPEPRKRRSTGAKAPREFPKQRRMSDSNPMDDDSEPTINGSTGGITPKYSRSESSRPSASDYETDGQKNARKEIARKSKPQFPVEPIRPGPSASLDVFASAEEWAKIFERMDKIRELIRGPAPLPMPPAAAVPVVPPPAAAAPPPGLDFTAMIGLFKGLAEVMVAVTTARGVQPPVMPAAQAPPVQVATAADPLTLATFERLLAALGKSNSDK